MELLQLQQRFTLLVADLIIYAFNRGYEVTVGELYRPKEVALIYAKQGKGSAHSLHCDRLAVDLNLFYHDKYLTESEHYEMLGKYWESLATPEVTTCWGGRFKDAKGKPKPDGNHFSVMHNGKK